MNQGHLDSSLLEKDIKLIDFYAAEEQKKLKAIVTNMNDCGNNYKSDNMTLFSKNIEDINRHALDLNEKRKLYTDNLRRVIIKYQDIIQATRKLFQDKEDLL